MAAFGPGAEDRSMPDNTAGQVAATWQGLAQIPQLLTDVKAAVLTLKTLITTPAAAVATGSPPASGAIVLLGAELAMFLAQTVQAVEDDIEALRKVKDNYERNEQELAAAAARGGAAVGQVDAAPRPQVGPGTGTVRPPVQQQPPAQVRPAPTPRPDGRGGNAGRDGNGGRGSTRPGSPSTTAPRPTPRPTPRPAVRPVVVPPAAPTGAAAVDPARRQDLLDAGQIALTGLVDVVGARLERVPTPRAPRQP